MAVALAVTQLNGVVTQYCRITDIRIQPKGSVSIQLSFYVSPAVREAGGTSVSDQVIILDVASLDITLPIVPQLYAQLVAAGAVLAGGTMC